MHHRVYVERKERNLRQIDVAKIIRQSRNSYGSKERGEIEFTITEGLRLARFYKLTLNDLFEEEEHTSDIEVNNSDKIVKELTHHLEGIVRLLKTNYK